MKHRIFITLIAAAMSLNITLPANAASQSVWTGASPSDDWFEPANWAPCTPEQAEYIWIENAQWDIAQLPYYSEYGLIADAVIRLDQQYMDIVASEVYIRELQLQNSELFMAESLFDTDTLWVGRDGIPSSTDQPDGSRVAIYSGVTRGKSLIMGDGGKLNFYDGMLFMDSVIVGSGGRAELNVYEYMDTDQFAIGLGYNADSIARIQPSGDVYISESLLCGICGKGEIMIAGSEESNGRLHCDSAILATAPGSQAELSVNGVLDVDADMIAGLSGHAEITVGPFGELNAENFVAASQCLENHGSCNITITGWDSQWSSPHFPPHVESHGTVEIAGDAVLGEYGPATMTLNFGHFGAGNLYLGLNSYEETHQVLDNGVAAEPVPVRSSGEITMENSSYISAQNLYVGCEGDGRITMANSYIHVPENLYVPASSGGTGVIEDTEQGYSQISAGDMYIGCIECDENAATKPYGSVSGTVTVSNSLTLGKWGNINTSWLTLENAAFYNESTTPENTTLGTVVFYGENTLLEAASGADGIDKREQARNFEIAELEISTNTTLNLQDEVDNDPIVAGRDVVYAGTLRLRSGSVLKLNGLTLIYDELIDSGGTVITDGGELIATRNSGGDINGDGETDLDDFIILKQNYGSGTTLAEGDLNLDGAVNLDDFIILKQSYGR